MNYTIQDIAHIIHATPAQWHAAQIAILLTDSRSLTFPQESLFFALVTARNNGHKYVVELYHKGVRNFVVSEYLSSYDELPEANILRVPHTLKALQRLAEVHRASYNTPVIGITGSNGKTVIKEWLYQLLQYDYSIVRSPRSYNSQIGVPLSVWQMNEDATLGIFEAGISEVDEMSALQHIIRPQIGIFTNLGVAHHEGFSSLQEKCMEKLKLFADTDVIIYDGDNSMITSCMERSGIGAREIAWSRVDKERPLFISKIEKGERSTTITYFYLRYEHRVTIPFVEDASIENAIHCIAVLSYLGKGSAENLARMAQLRNIAMRLEVKEGRNGCLIIDDTYNSDLKSIEIALDFHARRAGDTGLKKSLILSDIRLSETSENAQYKRVAALLEQQGIEHLVAIGGRLSIYKGLFKRIPQVEFYPTTIDFLHVLQPHTFVNEQVLIKGARDFDFGQISEALELKQHETVLEVNLDAIAYNYNLVKSLLHPTTKVVCMVKAFGYGAGSYELAKSLQECNCDYLAVAVADEGVALRKAGITLPIMVMNPEPSSFKSLFTYSLEPEIYSFRILENFIRETEHQGIINYPIHLKIDTGMHRLGFSPNEVEPLIHLLRQQPAVMVRSIFSHFAGSDEEQFDPFSQQQIATFTQVADRLQAVSPYKIYRHLLNTAGILRFPHYQFDMVRLGIGLYGIDPTPTHHGWRPVTTLKTVILQLKEIAAGETVGYSRKGEIVRPSRIAAIPIGYADGYDRRLGNGVGAVWINGAFAPTIGNICMDLCMVDVTDIHCKEGDEVEVFGEHVTVEEIAKKLNTIPYEVTTGISSRVKRLYYRE